MKANKQHNLFAKPNLVLSHFSSSSDINAVDNQGANVMHKAFLGGKIDLFDFLLLKGVKMKVPTSPPPLHFAAMGGHKVGRLSDRPSVRPSVRPVRSFETLDALLLFSRNRSSG